MKTTAPKGYEPAKSPTELDDYERNVWFKEKIPKELPEIDIGEFFKSKK